MMKAIFSGVQSDGRDEQVALVLAVVVVGDDDDLAAGEGGDRRFDRFVRFGCSHPLDLSLARNRRRGHAPGFAKRP